MPTKRSEGRQHKINLDWIAADDIASPKSGYSEELVRKVKLEWCRETNKRNNHTIVPDFAHEYSVQSQRWYYISKSLSSRLVYIINYQLVHDKSGQNINKTGELERMPLVYLVLFIFPVRESVHKSVPFGES